MACAVGRGQVRPSYNRSIQTACRLYGGDWIGSSHGLDLRALCLYILSELIDALYRLKFFESVVSANNPRLELVYLRIIVAPYQRQIHTY